MKHGRAAKNALGLQILFSRMAAKVSFIWYFTLSVKQKCPLNTTSGGRRRLFLDLEGAGETYFTAPPYLQPGKLD